MIFTIWDCVIMFSALLICAFIRCSLILKEYIKKIGINWDFYPKHYIVPCEFIRKFFCLKKEEILKFIYYEFFVTISYLLIVPIAVLMYIVSQYNLRFIRNFFVVVCMIVILNFVLVFIISSFYNRKKHQKQIQFLINVD